MKKLTNKKNRLIATIEELSAEVAGLRGEATSRQSETRLHEQIRWLEQAISDLEIGKAKLEEANARDQREVEHKIGLERRRQEVDAEAAMKEVEVARREAVLEVRETSLAEATEQFDKQLTFITDRMNEENKYVRKMFSDVLKRLPDVSLAMEQGSGDGE